MGNINSTVNMTWNSARVSETVAPARRRWSGLLRAPGVLALLGASGLTLQAQLVVNSFTMINADTDAPVAAFDPLTNGAVLNLVTLPTANLISI